MEEIPQNIMEAAAGCQHEHSCIHCGKEGNQQVCQVKNADGVNVLFLNNGEQKECSYKSFFGNNHVCRCPLHYYLHENYWKGK